MAPRQPTGGPERGGGNGVMSIWIDVGSASCYAEDLERIEDVRSVHAGAAEAGMKSVITLKSGRWFYARFARTTILRRVKQAAARTAEPQAEGREG